MRIRPTSLLSCTLVALAAASATATVAVDWRNVGAPGKTCGRDRRTAQGRPRFEPRRRDNGESERRRGHDHGARTSQRGKADGARELPAVPLGMGKSPRPTRGRPPKYCLLSAFIISIICRARRSLGVGVANADLSSAAFDA